MSLDYSIASDVAGAIPLTGFTVDGSEPGTTVSLPTIFVVKAGDEDASELCVTALLATRKSGDGSLSDGWEAVEELWIEAITETSDWTPIGGGPGGEALALTADDFSGLICPVQLRMTIPLSPASAGDIAVSIEVFFK